MGALNADKPQPLVAVRRHSRSPAQQPAMIIVASHLPPIRCTVINISEEGAGLWVGSTIRYSRQLRPAHRRRCNESAVAERYGKRRTNLASNLNDKAAAQFGHIILDEGTSR